MQLTTFILNEPITNTFEPTQSVLPERFIAITEPVSYPIMGNELTSITQEMAPTEELIEM